MAIAALSILSLIAYSNSSYSEWFNSLIQRKKCWLNDKGLFAVWTRLLFFLMPLVFIVSIARAGWVDDRLHQVLRSWFEISLDWQNHDFSTWLLFVLLHSLSSSYLWQVNDVIDQANVIWECNHGGQLYNETLAAIPDYQGDGTSAIPTGFCRYVRSYNSNQVAAYDCCAFFRAVLGSTLYISLSRLDYVSTSFYRSINGSWSVDGSIFSYIEACGWLKVSFDRSGDSKLDFKIIMLSNGILEVSFGFCFSLSLETD